MLEETGVRATFDGVLAMRQAHGFAFGKSDLFCVVALKLQPGPQVGLWGVGLGGGNGRRWHVVPCVGTSLVHLPYPSSCVSLIDAPCSYWSTAPLHPSDAPLFAAPPPAGAAHAGRRAGGGAVDAS